MKRSYTNFQNSKTQVLKNRHVLLKIIETLLLCGKQNIAIRGHIPQFSNFMTILNSKAQGNDILTDHLANSSSSRAKYTSPDIQNEIINIIGNQIRTSIVESCKNSQFFTLIADETTDTSTFVPVNRFLSVFVIWKGTLSVIKYLLRKTFLIS